MIVNLIAGTTTKKGLKVHADIDGQSYPAGIKVSDSKMAEIRLQREAFHGEWNYEILPRTDTVISQQFLRNRNREYHS